MSFKIGDVSKLLGVSVETLRYYEQEGVIRPERKNYSTTRVYSIWDVYELMEFKLYRNIGLSINEIKNITQKGDIDYA